MPLLFLFCSSSVCFCLALVSAVHLHPVVPVSIQQLTSHAVLSCGPGCRFAFVLLCTDASVVLLACFHVVPDPGSHPISSLHLHVSVSTTSSGILRMPSYQLFPSWCGKDLGTWLVQDVSFRVPAGTSCALVGTSGSGKSTVLRLLYRSAPSTPVAAQPRQVSMSAGTSVLILWASHQQARHAVPLL